ncbi:TrkH family potassium uptake protein [Halostella litorea]|uniref:TrkH family potassium uptake protein n=1 Tax=Halostella litorea TaxID=2528831 RepID=UPI001091A6CC|nr:TrkH family potassium uptake protein [Halostella litorea]
MTRHRTRVPAALATIARDVGSLLLVEAALMTLTVAVALGFREFHAALAFLLAGGITAGVGGAARLRFADAPDPRMKHGMVIAASGWFAVALFGSLGFFLTASLTPDGVAAGYVPAGASYSESSLRYFEHPLHALFESMSGWTGSGLTMAVHEPSLPHALQWWRSLIQWVGGVGVIVLTVSILSRPGSGSYALYRSETREEKIHPSVVSTVRTVWKIFVAYSVLAVVALFAAIHWTQDLSLFDAAWQALNHAMTGLSTGGFSVTDNSIATYDSPLIETVLLPIMALGAIAFPIHYGVLNGRDPRLLVSDLQTRWLFVLFAVGVVGLSAQNALVDPVAATAFDGSTDAVRDSTFQWISALSCTGFQSAPIGEWSPGGKLLVSVAMVIGGAAGSTVGGIKIVRAYTVARGIRWQFSRVFLPKSAVVNARIGDRVLDRGEMAREFSEAAIVTILWVILLVASSLVLVNASGADYASALFEVASAQGNVGLSAGITGPEMPAVAEGMFVLNMWVGRLEIIPVLVLARSVLYGLEP